MARQCSVRFSIENAAFDDDLVGEVEMIFAKVGAAIANGECFGDIRDINGNTVGQWHIDRGNDC